MPGADHTICHDSIGRELFDILTETRLRIELQPRGIFTTLIPHAVLFAHDRPPYIVPDASSDVALVVTADHGHVTVTSDEMVALPPSVLCTLE